MVFKAATGASQPAQDAYKSDDTYAESDMAALDVTSQQPDIYKNRIVLQWTDFRPTEVSSKGESRRRARGCPFLPPSLMGENFKA